MRSSLWLTAALVATSCGTPSTEPSATTTAEQTGTGGDEAEPAQTPTETQTDLPTPERVANTMQELFDACRLPDLPAAAALIVYRGSDQTQRWRRAANAGDPEERRQVTLICGRIDGLLSAASGYEKIAYESQTQSEGVWHVWQVAFDTSSGPVEQVFAFVEVDGRFLLGDID